MRQLVLNIRPHAQLRLDNFVVGDNQDLVAALRQQLRKEDGSLLYCWGAAGSGKTHLLQGAMRLASAERPCRYVDAQDWREQETDESSAREALSHKQLLLIDNAHAMNEDMQAHLFRALIGAAPMQAAVVMTGDAPPTHLALRPDVQSRISQGLIFHIKPPNDEHKAAALMQHANGRGMALGEDIVRYLLRHGRRDLPWLMAVLDALDEASLSLARPITLPLLRDILRNSVEQHEAP